MQTEKMIGPIPQMGFGTWNRVGEECFDCVMAALETGYRHIDTAEMYDNERWVGKAIAESGIGRENVFVTTKVAPENLGPGQVRPHIEASIDRLGFDHVDLALVHWPSIGDRYEIEDYLGQFAEAQEAGLTTHIGVANFTRRHLRAAVDLLGASRIATNQCEIHVLMQNRPIVDACRKLGIAMTAYCPLARGAVSGSAALRAIGARHGATAGQIALAFLMAQGHIVIPSSGNSGRIAENFAAREIELSPGEIETIRRLDADLRLVNGAWSPKWDR